MARRLPLENEASERLILGAILKDHNFYWDHRPYLKPDLFAKPLHRRFMEAIEDLATTDRHITVAGTITRVAVEENDADPAGYVSVLLSEESEPGESEDTLSDLVQIRARRKMAVLGKRLLTESTADNDDPAETRLENAIAEAADIAQEASLDLGSTKKKELRRMVEEATTAYRSHRSAGYPWYLPEIGMVLGDDIEPGWLIGLLGDSGAGKSSLAIEQSYHLAEKGVPVAFFAGDQTVLDSYRQMAAQQVSLSSRSIRHGQYSEMELQSFMEMEQKINGLPVEIIRMGRPRASEVIYRLKEFKRRYGRRGVALFDHLKRFRFDDPRSGLSEGINQVCGDIKAGLTSTEYAGIMLMQRNAEGGRREIARPIPGDAYGGDGVWEAFDAGLALFVEERIIRRQLRVTPASDTQKVDSLTRRLASCEGKAELIGLKTRFSEDGRMKTIRRIPHLTQFKPFDSIQEAREDRLIDDQIPL